MQEIRQLRDTIQNKQENERWRWSTTETKRSVRIWLLSEMEKELSRIGSHSSRLSDVPANTRHFTAY
ncbi:hypothetical protein [Piscirickettsia salmonis]|uniref:hypothetical protein n=1 Tax=Piscirickettsia salmonis TaxID=1238 RepID=UPI001E2D0A68|nr:hypothetical protein [Piscirickettsia salmonis]